jgi:hypothetical protein
VRTVHTVPCTVRTVRTVPCQSQSLCTSIRWKGEALMCFLSQLIMSWLELYRYMHRV